MPYREEGTTENQDQELRPFAAVSDELVLAAIERGQRHDDGRPITGKSTAEHLGFIHNPMTTRRLRPQLESLERDGLLGEVSQGRQRALVPSPQRGASESKLP